MWTSIAQAVTRPSDTSTDAARSRPIIPWWRCRHASSGSVRPSGTKLRSQARTPSRSSSVNPSSSLATITEREHSAKVVCVTNDARVKRITLIAAVLGSGVVFLDGTVVNVALPAIVDELDTGFVAQQWIVEGYLLTLGALLLVGGSLGDILGRKRVFMAGLAGFGATSLICAMAPTPALLIAARILQGAAGALLVPASLALITATFPASERGGAIGSWTAWTGIAFVVGPLGGGAIVEYVSWRWIFAINVPLVLLTLAIARGIQESFDEEVSQRIDYLGALLVSLGLAGPVFALIEQQSYGWADPL